jgi:hypothetical protein
MGDGTCSACMNGRMALQGIKGDLRLVVVRRPYCPRCLAKNYARPLLPRTHRWVLESKLIPSEKVKIPLKVQDVLLAEIQDGSLVGHTVLYSGPPKIGKTVMAAKLLEMTYRTYLQRGFREAFPNCIPPIYRVNVPDWMETMMAYKTRDFNADRVLLPPAVNAQSIRTVRLHKWEYEEAPDGGYRESWTKPYNSSDYPPVLFLEELDKFTASESTRRWLFSFLNTVMEEAGGAIVSKLISASRSTGGLSSLLSTASGGFVPLFRTRRAGPKRHDPLGPDHHPGQVIFSHSVRGVHASSLQLYLLPQDDRSSVQREPTVVSAPA